MLITTTLRYAGALVLASAAAGIVFEEVGRRRDRDRMPRVGRSVDIGGRSLNIYCSGEGSVAAYNPRRRDGAGDEETGVRPIRIFQSIAAGVLGRVAFQGGLATAVLGACLHFFIAFVVVLTFYLASRRAPVLTRHAVVCGLLYGLVVYLVMNFVVVPLSAASAAPPSVPVLVNGLLIHAFGVGLPAALFVRAAGT